MLLVVDVGNTHTVLGLYDDERLVHDFRIETAKGRTSDEYHVLLLNLLELAGIKRPDVRASILASVVPSLNEGTTEARMLARTSGRLIPASSNKLSSST